MENIYFFVDGSALTAQIRQLQRSHAIFRNRKLCPQRYIEFCVSRLRHLVGDSYKRATFYFPKGDEVAVEEFIVVPDHAIPGEVTDLHFKFCGQKLKKSAEFAKFVDEKVPAEFEGRFQKSEKGVDTEICCDALRLAATGRLDRLFLLSNDSDFIPLCRTLKEFGSNVSILHLSAATLPNRDLLREADSYNIVAEEFLSGMFLPVPDPEPEPENEPGQENEHDINFSKEFDLPEPDSEKPDTEPSDMSAADRPEIIAEESRPDTAVPDS